jgi:LysR family glycine cleavage system transcriptional activator
LASDGRVIERAADLLRYPLIHFDWMNRDPDAPTWRRWLATARSIDPDLIQDKARDLSFREELHAIDAVVAGQGIAICSNIVVGRELENGSLVKAHPLSLPGYSFYVVWVPHVPRSAVIESFLAWMRTVA